MFALLRLTLPITALIVLLTLITPVLAHLLPPAQIIPVTTGNNPIILLVDVQRHLAAARRANSGVVTTAAVSPDNQKIAFSMFDAGHLNIYVGGLYDNEYQRLTIGELGGDNPSWSPDNRQLVFVGLEPNNKRGIYTVGIDHSDVQTIIKAGRYDTPSWSPDGRYLAFASILYRNLPDLYLIDTTCGQRCDGQTVQLTSALSVDAFPTWSPDGSTLVFLSDRSGSYQIYKLNLSCLQPNQIKCMGQTPTHIRIGQLSSPTVMVWSPDGQMMYFRAWDPVIQQPGLYAVNSLCDFNCQPELIYNLKSLLRGRRD